VGDFERAPHARPVRTLACAPVVSLDTPSRVSEVLRGKKRLSMAMVQRLRARFRVPAELLLPPPKQPPGRRARKQAAA
jgi:hypothetical protein